MNLNDVLKSEISALPFGEGPSSFIDILKERPLLLALSGGIDSMVLLDVLQQAQLPFGVCSINHKLRPESDREIEQLELYCIERQIPFFSKVLNPEEKSSQDSWESWARIERYIALENIRKKHHFSWILTAHHQDDQIESVLQNILRGTALRGLRGVHEYDEVRSLVRPFLKVPKSQIIEWAQKNNVPYWEDSSNVSHQYQRNVLRHEFIPNLKNSKIFVEKLAQVAHLAQIRQREFHVLFEEWKNFHSDIVSDSNLLKIPCTIDPSEYHFLRELLGGLEVWRSLSQERNWQRLCALIQGQKANLDFEPKIRAKRVLKPQRMLYLLKIEG